MAVVSKCQIMDLVESALVRNGLPPAMAKRAAEIVTREFWCRYSGVRIYFAKGRKTSSRQSAAIYAAFSGSNHVELAQEFGLSVSRIEQIIANALREKTVRQLPK